MDVPFAGAKVGVQAFLNLHKSKLDNVEYAVAADDVDVVIFAWV